MGETAWCSYDRTVTWYSRWGGKIQTDEQESFFYVKLHLDGKKREEVGRHTMQSLKSVSEKGRGVVGGTFTSTSKREETNELDLQKTKWVPARR